jgi:hypothetical protein
LIDLVAGVGRHDRVARRPPRAAAQAGGDDDDASRTPRRSPNDLEPPVRVSPSTLELLDSETDPPK